MLVLGGMTWPTTVREVRRVVEDRAIDATAAWAKLQDMTIRRLEKAGADGDPEIVIDRPKGYQKTFRSAQGTIAVTYPLDYGYLKGLVNPQDDEDADVFVGTGGPHFGRYMKGNTTSGAWQPDEFKWYTGLTDAEHAAMFKFWADQDPRLIRDPVAFPDHAGLLADIRRLATKAAGVYQEEPGGSFTHDGARYDLNALLRRIADRPVYDQPVNAVRWVLRHDRPDPARVAAADLAAPVLVAADRRGRPTVVDGTHRTARAVRERRDSLPAIGVTPEDLEAVALKTAANLPSAWLLATGGAGLGAGLLVTHLTKGAAPVAGVKQAGGFARLGDAIAHGLGHVAGGVGRGFEHALEHGAPMARRGWAGAERLGSRTLAGASHLGGRGLAGLEEGARGLPRLPHALAGLAPGEHFLGAPEAGSLSRLRAGAGNAYNALYRPRYPGLDRPALERRLLEAGPPGRVTAFRSFEPGRAALVPPRALDRTRSLAAGALRSGSLATTAATGGLAAYNVLNTYPNEIANQVGLQAGLGPTAIADTQARTRAAAPGILADQAAQLVGRGDRSALGQLHGAIAREALPQELRASLYYARQNNPVRYGLTDALRSGTPGGLLATLAARAAASPTVPDYPGIIRRNVHEYLPAVLDDPAGTEASPYYGLWRNALLPREHVLGPKTPDQYMPSLDRVVDDQATYPAVSVGYNRVEKHDQALAPTLGQAPFFPQADGQRSLFDAGVDAGNAAASQVAPGLPPVEGGRPFKHDTLHGSPGGPALPIMSAISSFGLSPRLWLDHQIASRAEPYLDELYREGPTGVARRHPILSSVAPALAERLWPEEEPRRRPREPAAGMAARR